jgi:hypothetical protein
MILLYSFLFLIMFYLILIYESLNINKQQKEIDKRHPIQTYLWFISKAALLFLITYSIFYLISKFFE